MRERDLLRDIAAVAEGETSKLPPEVVRELQMLRDAEEKGRAKLAAQGQCGSKLRSVCSSAAPVSRNSQPVKVEAVAESAPIWPGEISASAGFASIARNLKGRQACIAFREKVCDKVVADTRKAVMEIRDYAAKNRRSFSASAAGVKLADFEAKAAKTIENAENARREARKLAHVTAGMVAELTTAFDEGMRYTKLTDQLLRTKGVVRMSETLRASVQTSRAKLDAMGDPLDQIIFGDEEHTPLTEAIAEGYLQGGGQGARVVVTPKL